MELVRALDATACVLSRAIGDVLVLVAEDPGPFPTLQLGRGYLASDFPETVIVLQERRAYTTSVRDPGADAKELEVLDDLGFGSLLMLPFEVGGEAWGLVEVYDGPERQFSAQDAEQAAELIGEAGIRFALLRAV